MKLKTLFILLTCTCFNIKAQDLSNVRANIDTLCGKDFFGRGATYNGVNKAADFLTLKFKRLGLKSFNDSYSQNFAYNINTFPGDMQFQWGKKKFAPGIDFIVDASCPQSTGVLKPLFIDTLLFFDAAFQKRFLKKSLLPYAIVYPAAWAKKVNELPKELQEKLTEAGSKVIIQEKKLTSTLSPTQHNRSGFELLRHSSYTFTGKIRFRVDATLEQNFEAKNIIGYIEGKNKPDSFVVISAHYDHLGGMGKSTYFPGANDNASGCAMLLELASFYSRPENQPSISIVFMLFAGEEAGLLGSRHYTENPLFPLTKIKFLVNLDLLGTGEEGMMVVNGAIYEKEFNHLLKINEEKKYLPAIKKRGAAANSDHYFFYKSGVPSFFFYTMGGISAYHDVLDKPETLPLTKFREVFGLIIDFVNGN
ncbi:MAG TPA: M28 family peptidase [Cytophagaceae bacterium]|jgi:hypothetical protein